MKDRTYEVVIALLCVALAVAGIYYLTADSPIWNEWKSHESSSEAPPKKDEASTPAPSASSDKEIDDRISPDENASPEPAPPSKDGAAGNGQAGDVVSKQAPGEEIDIRPPETEAGSGTEAPPASGKEMTDRIPETEG